MACILHHEMKRGTADLKTIAFVAPLLGTFGTAVGLLNSFAYHPRLSSELLDIAGGPADSLVVVILSLPVAIFAYIGFCYLRQQTDIVNLEMRTTILWLLNQLAGRAITNEAPAQIDEV